MQGQCVTRAPPPLLHCPACLQVTVHVRAALIASSPRGQNLTLLNVRLRAGHAYKFWSENILQVGLWHESNQLAIKWLVTTPLQPPHAASPFASFGC